MHTRERGNAHVPTCATVRRLSMVCVAHSTWYLRALCVNRQKRQLCSKIGGNTLQHLYNHRKMVMEGFIITHNITQQDNINVARYKY
uniref:Uncharacterized protein n=1 Tax=Romanomermis culicivorax TaxID=13658 RepID=A0A915K8J0_ROMCU